MNSFKELYIREGRKRDDVYCYKDNYLSIMFELVREGYYLLEIVFIKDKVLQCWLGQDYEVQLQMTKEFDFMEGLEKMDLFYIEEDDTTRTE